MTTDNKTLADVQPGGRVRLGDGLPPCPFCGHSDFDQWPCEYIDASGANVVRCARCHAAAPMKVWHTLSAQPSPGGQGDALPIESRARELLAAELERDGNDQAASAIRSGDTTYGMKLLLASIRAITAALAARQPVGQDWQHIANEWADAATNGVQWLRNIRDGASTVADALACMESNVERIQQLKPPAQAVDLGQPDPTLLRFYQVAGYPALVEALEEHVLKLIDLRKRSVKPWEDTMPPTLLPKWIRENSPVLAKDLLALADRWQDEAAATWGEAPAHAAKQQCCDELRALIDSQAVGNG
ncbi:hypothetical protein ACNPNN_12935 [Stenotrophomonas geniculata]|uniref:hypothetical protein n=1 Tax=Stenotrophomonas geniculata TaxID=86188 RepID=UPI003AAEE4A0